MDNVTKILLRQDTVTNWDINKSVILGCGEPAVAIGSNGTIRGFKIGDGISTWENLPYFEGDPSGLIEAVSQLELEYSQLNSQINGTDEQEGIATTVEELDNTVNNEETGLSALNNVVNEQAQTISGKEDVSNKVTSLTVESTDTQYPSAKCVFDITEQLQDGLTAEIQDRQRAINEKVPNPPSNQGQFVDGTYILKCIVVNHVPTYTWELQE